MRPAVRISQSSPEPFLPSEHKALTTAEDMPVGDNQNTLTAGPRGSPPTQDFQPLERLAEFNRERNPERAPVPGCPGMWPASVRPRAAEQVHRRPIA